MIEVLNQQNKYSVNLRKFKQLLHHLVSLYKLDDPEITLAFVGQGRIRALNRKYLDTDKPTDVLSFPIGEKGPDGKYYLGDIIISVPQAFNQCFRKPYGLERELETLVVHGFLHLLGFDHSEGIEEEEEKIKTSLLDGAYGT